MYQSNLYGIETLHRRAFPWSCIVSIEPLWNWNVNPSDYFDRVGFVSIEPLWNWNTELLEGFVCASLYQSNLYGIETTILDESRPESDSINRTFMELKLTYWENNWQIKMVSIEPLWNWNAKESTYYADAFLYQSNLYGIETITIVDSSHGYLCINRPPYHWDSLLRSMLPFMFKNMRNGFAIRWETSTFALSKFFLNHQNYDNDIIRHTWLHPLWSTLHLLCIRRPLYSILRISLFLLKEAVLDAREAQILLERRAQGARIWKKEKIRTLICLFSVQNDTCLHDWCPLGGLRGWTAIIGNVTAIIEKF